MPESQLSSIALWGHPHWQSCLMAMAACGITTASTLPRHDCLDPVNAAMLFLPSVVFVTTQLGLAICRTIVKAHGGRIEPENLSVASA